MKILALEPYYGGSHRAFIDGWIARSEHDWTLLTLPPHHWKWRMRHSALSFAERVNARVTAGERWDAVWCSDMLDLAAFRGLVDSSVGALPHVLYFHENQLTYPDARRRERDVHFGFTNYLSARAADGVWFNSQYHHDVFLTAVRELLGRMPDYASAADVDAVNTKSSVHTPAVEDGAPRGPRADGPARLLWAARWEADKGPGIFFDALQVLIERERPFVVDVLGGRSDDNGDVFATARAALGERVGRWGYTDSREDYVAATRGADIVVSTAAHEFFGIAVAEAVAQGAFPVVPNALAYPEVLGAAGAAFHDGSVDGVAAMLATGIDAVAAGSLWKGDNARGQRAMQGYTWKRRAQEMDAALQNLV